MKKNVVIPLMLFCIVGLTGCGINEHQEDLTINSESSLFESIDECESAENEVATEENSYDAYMKYRDFISPKRKEDVKLDPESERIYQRFMDGEEPAQYDIEGDIAQYIRLSEALENGKRYTLKEIIEKLASEGQYGEGWNYEVRREGYIDLGLDENYELCMDIGASEFNLTLVIKNIGGKLKICFAGDSWSRKETTVKYSGYVESYGSGGAYYHGGETGYIDAEGKYHFWFRSTEKGVFPNDDGKLIYNEKLIGENIGMYLESFSFDRFHEGKEYQYVYIVDSKGREDVKVDITQPGNANEMAQKAIETSGNIYLATDNEAKALMEEQRMIIGLSDEIYKYGDELYPY